MKEIKGNFWETPAKYKCITTNGIVKKNGDTVMGAGISKEAVERAKAEFSVNIAKILGDKLRRNGKKQCFYFSWNKLRQLSNKI